MDELLILLAIGIFFSPLVMSIIALVNVSLLKREVRRLSDPEPKPAPAPDPASLPATEPEPAPVVTPEPAPAQPPALPSQKTVEPSRKKRGGMELMLGGNAAAFAGIAILITGIVFLVGYSIQQGWIGPGTRVVMGLLAGGALIGIGHWMESRQDQRFTLLARVLTGGGSALFYFCVFAAYGIYELIGPLTAGLGLAGSALAVFGLAAAYRSQAVGVLGVLGAFITPLLIGGAFERGTFPLVYVAVINGPVILLGLQKRWQVLYNLAFGLTVLCFCSWLDWFGSGEWRTGLIFAALYFLEYAALGLLKLRREQQPGGRRADIIRLLLASLLLLGTIYWILEEADLADWLGAAFLGGAMLHVLLATTAFRLLRRFNEEITAFLAGGLVFAVLALPAQLDGEWVSLGWAVEGAVLAWFAARVRSRALQAGAFVIGSIGILKALLFDFSLHTVQPDLFLNIRFAVGLLSAALLGLQSRWTGWLEETASETGNSFQSGLLWAAVLAGLAVFSSDLFCTLGSQDAAAWMLSSLSLLIAGAALVLFMPPRSSLNILGGVLLVLFPFKLLLVDSWFYFDGLDREAFRSLLIYAPLGGLALAAFILPHRCGVARRLPMQPGGFATLLNISALAATIGLITLETLRIDNDWAGSAVTILWAGCAILLTVFGLIRQRPAHRWFGLILIGLTTLKVLAVDSSELQGPERIAAFICTGLILLVLSFAYQKASARLAEPEGAAS